MWNKVWIVELIMPAALDLDWEAVKTLSIAIGVSEAVRRMGIEAHAMAVYQRARREGWQIKDRPRGEPLPGTVQKVVKLVKTPSQVMAEELKDLGSRSRLSLARGLAKGAEHVENLPAEIVLADAQNVKSLVQSTSIVHGWQNSAPTVNVNLGMTAQREGAQPETLEAEWSDGDVDPVLL